MGGERARSWQLVECVNPSEGPGPQVGHSCTASMDSLYVVCGTFRSLRVAWQHVHASASLLGVVGNIHTSSSAVYVFDFDEKKWWKPEVVGNVPPSRKGHSAVLYKNALYVFGGYDAASGRASNDFFKLDLGASPPIHRFCDLGWCVSSHDCAVSFVWSAVRSTGGIAPWPLVDHCAVVCGEFRCVVAQHAKEGIHRVKQTSACIALTNST